MAVVHIKDVLDDVETRWGSPEENVGRIVPFGIAGVDDKLLGVPVDRGGIFAIQGKAGSRKTTLVANIIVNQCLSGRLPQGYHVGIDTLESGVTVERYADIILAIVATKYVIYWHHNDTQERDIVKLLGMGLPDIGAERLCTETCSYIGGKTIPEAVLRPEFFIYHWRTPRQQEAIEMARAVVRNWPILLFGVSEHPDPDVARQRTTNVVDLDASYARWCWLSQHMNMRELVVDHLQQYILPGMPNDYDQMRTVTQRIAAWQKPHRGVAWIISQIGVTAEREARQQKTSAYAIGGRVLEAESQLTWEVQYDMENPYVIRLRRPVKSRIGIHPDMGLPIEPNSGAFIGRAVEYRQVKLEA